MIVLKKILIKLFFCLGKNYFSSPFANRIKCKLLRMVLSLALNFFSKIISVLKLKMVANSSKFLLQTGGIGVPCPCVWVGFVTVFTGIIWWR